MGILGEREGKRLQTLLAWSSIAYAAGFLTVMTHTARLGIPVLELLKPVYIWIGFPLALVVFSSGWLWKLVKSRIDELRDEFETTRKEVSELLRERGIEKKEIADLFDLYISLVAAASAFFPVGLLTARVLDSLRDQYRQSVSGISEEHHGLNRLSRVLEKNLGRLAYLVRGMAALNRFLDFVFVISLIPVGCYLYIFIVYPLIPQSIGGGKPMPVVLFLDAEKVPVDSPEIRALFPAETLSGGSVGTIATVELELLYSTDDEYYVGGPNQSTISFSKRAVEGILWLSDQDVREENSDSGSLPLVTALGEGE